MFSFVKKEYKQIVSFLKQKNGSEKLNIIEQFLKFGIVGMSNVAISYLINISVLVLLNPFCVSWDYIIGNVLAFALSVLWSFYWNNRVVFKENAMENREICKALFKTYISYSFTGIILNNILSWLWISVLAISKFIAPLFNSVISVPLNFIILKLWVFKDKS